MKAMLELFSGSGVMAQAFKRRGYRTLTIDNTYQSDMNRDVLELTRDDIVTALGKEPDVIWASPPCTSFSVASIGRHWIKSYDGTIYPDSARAKEGIALLRATLRIISWFPDAVFFIENPRGMMRRMRELEGIKRYTVTYCQYGESHMKPTDIWTNCDSWTPRPPCRNGDPCHVRAPRGAKTGVQGIKGSYLRSMLPTELCDEIASSFKTVP